VVLGGGNKVLWFGDEVLGERYEVLRKKKQGSAGGFKVPWHGNVVPRRRNVVPAGENVVLGRRKMVPRTENVVLAGVYRDFASDVYAAGCGEKARQNDAIIKVPASPWLADVPFALKISFLRGKRVAGAIG
jgi:hypothetical protein